MEAPGCRELEGWMLSLGACVPGLEGEGIGLGGEGHILGWAPGHNWAGFRGVFKNARTGMVSCF